MKNYITIGGIFSFIGAGLFLFLVLDFTFGLIHDPTNPKNVEKVAEKTIDEATPPQASVIIVLAPYGIVGAVLIVLLIVFWNKVMSYIIPLR